MRTLPVLGCWFILAQYFITATLSVPNRRKAEQGKDSTEQQHVMTGSQTFKKTNAIKRKLTKSPSIVETPEKKSELKKKTTVSINGKLVPIAGLAQTDKTVHVTVQNAAGQENQQAQGTGQQPQAVIQEVVPQNNVVVPQGTTQNSPPVLHSPTTLNLPSTLQSLPQSPGQQEEEPVGMSPPAIGMSPPRLPSQGSTGQIGMSPPANVGQELTGSTGQIGMSPPANVGQELTGSTGQIGMSPPANVGGLTGSTGQMGTSPQVQIQQLPDQTSTSQLTNNPQVQNACNTGTHTLQAGGKIFNIATNSEGQLTYKPVRC